MKSSMYRAIAAIMVAIVIFTTTSFHVQRDIHAEPATVLPTIEIEPYETPTPTPIESETLEVVDIPEEPVETEPVIETPLEEWEIILIARLTEAEAGGEPELGQRLVIDTVLNRMDHWAFPDTIEEVIYQPYHFSPVWSGGINCYTGREDLIQLVREEMIERADYDVIFFQAGGYSMYGVPMYQVGNHYFSSY